MQHRSTWFSDGPSHRDGKPVQNRIDFVIARRTDKVKLTNARSYGGFMTRSDHHPVIADFVLTLRAERSIDLCSIIYNEPNPSSVKVFNSALMETLPDVPVSCNIQTADVDSTWTTSVQSCHEAADKAFGKRPLHQRRIASTDPEVIELSKCQQKMHAQLHAENDLSIRQELRAKRNKILHQIRSLLRTRGDQFWQAKAEQADALRPDARSYYNAIRNLRTLRSGDKPSPVKLSDADGQIINDVDWQLHKFSENHHSVFQRDQLDSGLRSAFTENYDELFTEAEVAKGISTQNAASAVGCDGISAAMLQAGKLTLSFWLATFFNLINKLQYCPEDLSCGLIVPVYKKGKPIGAPKSYRPIMLLSVVQKVPTSVITRRTTHHPSMYVNESQAGFRPGWSTADGVFYSQSLCERALLGNWSYSAALLDFSGPFDMVQRKEALERLAEAGAATTTTSTLISNTSAKVKLQSRLSSPFETNIGVVQGDPLSPVMFMYMEHALREIDELCPVTSVPSPFFQYADDTTLHANDSQDVKQLVCNFEPIFIEDNLQLNKSKTQYITVNKKDNS